MANQARHETMLGTFTPRLLGAAGIGPGERVLDIGCGCGETSIAAAKMAKPGRVLGVDLSAAMLGRARELAAAEAMDNLAFERADVQVHAFDPGSFDVAISRFGVMFFPDPSAAFSNIARALRPGGRIAFLCWQAFERNQHAALPLQIPASMAPVPLPTGRDGPGPFRLADRALINDLLSGAELEDICIESVEERLRVGDDAEDVLGFYRDQPQAKAAMAAAPAEAIEHVLGAIREALLSHESPGLLGW